VAGDDDIKCLASGKGGLVYLITGKGFFWRATDYGDSWRNMGKISQRGDDEEICWPYGLIVLKSGTILVSDTNRKGGHIFRSTDQGKSWSNIGAISSKELYRFQEVKDGVLVNGWAGHVYKSLDDGLTWSDQGQLIDSPLYATEYLGRGIALQGSETGHIFRSTDDGQTWENLGVDIEATDDIVNLGNGFAVLSTYNNSKNMYFTRDYGLTWENIGTVPTTPGDWFDHVVFIRQGSKYIGIGGTNKGYVIRTKVY
jgi:photosystem II stability/assembly factor-like uncharacterized protein